MPIYAYRCESCGFEKDVLQKLSDPQLTDCPSCGKSTFKKQVTAAGFQLKGSGWYVTDFRNGSSGKKPDAADKKSESAESAAPAAAPAPTSASPAPAPAPASAPASAPAAKSSGSSE